jgi:predicted transcriptional regulator
MQTQTKMNTAQKLRSQISQSLFGLNLKNTRILVKVNRNINQILTRTCNQKTTTPAGHDSVGCCSIQRYARIATPQSTKTVKQQNENENDKEINVQLNSF